jgi:hypothetical protein
MADEKELDIIEKAHQAAERIELANKEKEALIVRMETVEKRMEGQRLLGGNSYAGAPPQKELTQEEKDKIGMRSYFKGTAIEGAFK